MKYQRGKIENPKPIKDLEHGKCRITFNGEDPEGIWVAKDVENGVMYLLNHALGFYPFPSWGLELPLSSNYDLGEIRGESPDDAVLTVHPETLEALKDFIKEDGEFDNEKYFGRLQKSSDEEE